MVSKPCVLSNKLAKQVIGNMAKRKALRWMVFVATLIPLNKFGVGVACELMKMKKN